MNEESNDKKVLTPEQNEELDKMLSKGFVCGKGSLTEKDRHMLYYILKNWKPKNE